MAEMLCTAWSVMAVLSKVSTSEMSASTWLSRLTIDLWLMGDPPIISSNCNRCNGKGEAAGWTDDPTPPRSKYWFLISPKILQTPNTYHFYASKLLFERRRLCGLRLSASVCVFLRLRKTFPVIRFRWTDISNSRIQFLATLMSSIIHYVFMSFFIFSLMHNLKF